VTKRNVLGLMGLLTLMLTLMLALSACGAPGFLVSRVTFIRAVNSTVLSAAQPNPAPVGYPVTLVTAHTDPDGINRVVLSVNGKQVSQQNPDLGEQTDFRVTHVFTPAEPGEYRLTITAYPNNPIVEVSEITATFVAVDEAMPMLGAASVPQTGGNIACMNRVKLLEDVPLPNDGEVQPGASFAKTWRLNNNGTCSWRAGYSFDLVSGPALSAETVDIPHVAMDGNVDITLNMVAPEKSGTYRSTWQLFDAEGTPFGEQYAVDITVPKTCQNPDIRLFTAQPATISAGEPSLLQWDVTGAKEISIDPGGTQTSGVASNLAVSPSQTTVYTLTARDGECVSSQKITVTVLPQTCAGITVNRFDATPATIYRGEQSTLQWDVSGATSVKISPAPEVSAAVNSLTVAPIESTTYSLTAENATCRLVRETTVTVLQSLTLIDFVAAANTAVWETDSGIIPFNYDPRTAVPPDLQMGYARWHDNIGLQNGDIVARALEINPVARPFVRGRYAFNLAGGTKTTDVLQVQMAYRAGVSAVSDATYTLLFVPVGQPPILLGTITLNPDGVPLVAAFPLSNVPAGSQGEFILQANKGASTAGDVVEWLSAVLVRP